MKLRHAGLATVFAVLAGGALSANAGEPPPQGSRPLSTILKSVEGQHLGTVAEAEFDDGLWQIKVCQTNGCEKLYINPNTGKEVRRNASGPEELPPTGSLALSSVIQGVEAMQPGRVSEVEFEHSHWEVELRDGVHKTKLWINPATGRPLR